jgi:hypothetical protein
MRAVDVGVLIVDVQINDAIAVAVEELVGGGESAGGCSPSQKARTRRRKRF